MNNRANIMYFIEHLCDMSQRENHLDFVRMMQRDILRVVDAVAPSDGSGAANVKVVRRVCLPPLLYHLHNLPLLPSPPIRKTKPLPKTQVLAGLQQKQILVPDTVLEIEAGLAERDTGAGGAHPALSPISPNAERSKGAGVGGAGEKSDADTLTATATAKVSNGVARLDKRQIEQRIEEDRERHKRLRESIWAVPDDDPDGEFERMWEEASEIGEDDFLAAEEDALERRMAAEVE